MSRITDIVGAVVALATLFPADMSAGGRRYRGGCDNVGEAGCCTHNETAVRNPITQVYSLDTGGVTAYSSYLSPMRYSGWGVALSGEWSKNLKQNPEKIQMTFAAKLDCSSLLNPAKSAGMLGASAYFGWGSCRAVAPGLPVAFHTRRDVRPVWRCIISYAEQQ